MPAVLTFPLSGESHLTQGGKIRAFYGLPRPSRGGGGFRRFLFPFAVLFLLVPVIIHKEREDDKENQDRHQGDGNVHARRVLYIVGDIP